MTAPRPVNPAAPGTRSPSWTLPTFDVDTDDAQPAHRDESSRIGRQMLVARHLIALALAMLGGFLPGITEQHRLPVVGILAVNAIAIGALTEFFYRQWGRFPMFLPWFEAAVAVAVAAVAPELLIPAAMMAMLQMSFGITAYGGLSVLPAAASAVASLGALVIVRKSGEVPGFSAVDPSAIVIFGIFIPGLAFVSDRVRQIEQKSRARYLEMLSGLEAAVYEANPDTLKFTFVSDQARDLFGMSPHEIRTRWSTLVHPDDRDRERTDRRAWVASGEPRFVLEFRLVDHDGRVIFVRDNARVDRDSSGQPISIHGVLTDVTRQQEAEATIRKQAQFDALTGLPNRVMFNERLVRAIESVKASGDTLTVLLLDLNGFKEVNDTLGHAVGDRLLQAIAGRLGAYLPERALVARLGGDEFAVLMQPATTRSAAALADTVTQCLQPPITVDDMTIQAGASIGVALYPADGTNPAELLRRADAAMYEAKQNGLSHSFAAPDDDEANLRRLQLLGELRASISTGDFKLFHQPKIDLRSGRVVGTEGLIRWQHRQFGLLTPAEFIELSELSGLIQPMTRWVLEQGIQQAAEWKRAGFDLTVALNLSVRNFFDQGLPTFIAGLLSQHQLPGEQIVLEITEREVMADRALARTALSAFRSLGVKISVDDFGTGFSSLSQLQLLPIDEIKVDASFVSGMTENQQDAVIVRSIIDLGHNLGLEVVAEGVEDVEQLRMLKAYGADRVQGYVVSKPLPAEDFMKWMKALVTPRTGVASPSAEPSQPKSSRSGTSQSSSSETTSSPRSSAATSVSMTSRSTALVHEAKKSKGNDQDNVIAMPVRDPGTGLARPDLAPTRNDSR